MKHPPVAPFRPHYVMYDKVVLSFKAFFKQSVPESPIEHYRVRHVNIIYFMEDDTMTVMEPAVLVKVYAEMMEKQLTFLGLKYCRIVDSLKDDLLGEEKYRKMTNTNIIRGKI